MRAGLFIVGIFLILLTFRCVNVLDDITAAIVAGGLGILCIWGAFLLKRVNEFEE